MSTIVHEFGMALPSIYLLHLLLTTFRAEGLEEGQEEEQEDAEAFTIDTVLGGFGKDLVFEGVSEGLTMA
jgi:hypothetical protein